MKIYLFEKLECWQHARQLTVRTFQITKNFPAEEKFGIISQMRWASISIASNIAEGTFRKTTKHQTHFSTIACSSTVELLNDLFITHDLKFLNIEMYEQEREMLEKQTLLISGLRKSQQKKRISFTDKLSKPLNP